MGIRAAALLAVVVAVVLAACAAPTPKPTAVLLAQGEFQDAPGAAGGHVTLSRLPDDSVTAVFSDVTTPDVDDRLLMTADHAIDPGQTCLESGNQIPGPPFEPGKEDVYILDPATTTPDLLAAYVIAHETGAETGCLVEIVAYANLDWGSAAPAADGIRMPAGVVVATGTFADAVGHVTGDVTITSAGGVDYVMSITGFSTSISTVDLSASRVAISPGETRFTEPWRIAWGTPSGSDIEETFSRADPTVIAAITVTTLPVESSIGCPLEYVGYANLTWDMPPSP